MGIIVGQPHAWSQVVVVFNQTTKMEIEQSNNTQHKIVMTQYQKMIQLAIDKHVIQENQMGSIVKSSNIVCVCLDHWNLNLAASTHFTTHVWPVSFKIMEAVLVVMLQPSLQ